MLGPTIEISGDREKERKRGQTKLINDSKKLHDAGVFGWNVHVSVESNDFTSTPNSETSLNVLRQGSRK